MLGLSTRRSAGAPAKCLACARQATVPRRLSSPSWIASKDFHASPSQAAFRPTWMPMRVKTPWVEALTKSRENAQSGQASSTPSAKPDLTPKRMSDSFYSAVRNLHPTRMVGMPSV